MISQIVISSFKITNCDDINIVNRSAPLSGALLVSDSIQREWTTFSCARNALVLCGHIADGYCERVSRANCNGARGGAHARDNEGCEAELTLLKEDVLKGAGYNPESTDETGIQCRANGRRTTGWHPGQWTM